ncbi:MAG: FtsB family cell division protein [Patescibacteria group bacterium]
MARRSKQANTSAILGLALLVVLVISILSFNYRLIKEREGNEEKIENLRAELESIEERKATLESNLSKTDDKEYIERVLREDFLMKKPGETKVVILTEEEEEEQSKEEEEEKTRFEKLKSLIPFVE